MSTQAPGVVKRPNSYFIDPAAVGRREGWNPRFDFGDVESLASSIKTMLDKDPASGGLINDIRVRRVTRADGKLFELVDGDRRLTAIELLMSRGVVFPEGIPAKIESAKADDTELLIKAIVANEGKPLLPLEEAAAFKRLRDAGMTLSDIEKAVSRSDNYIVGTLALLDADHELKEAVVAKKVSGNVAKNIAVHARGDKKKQAELVKEAVAAGKDKTARKAVLKKIDDARRAKAAGQGKKLKPRLVDEDGLSAMGERVAKMLKAKVAEAKATAAQDGDNPWDIDATTEAGVIALLDMVSKDAALVAAFTLGALQGLKAAAGVKVQFDL